jgi:hypothetical protein
MKLGAWLPTRARQLDADAPTHADSLKALAQGAEISTGQRKPIGVWEVNAKA